MPTYEDAIIEETTLLVANINKLKACISELNDKEMVNMIEKLRRIEKKSSLVCTFFRASAYEHLEQTQSTNRPPFSFPNNNTR